MSNSYTSFQGKPSVRVGYGKGTNVHLRGLTPRYPFVFRYDKVTLAVGRVRIGGILMCHYMRWYEVVYDVS